MGSTLGGRKITGPAGERSTSKLYGTGAAVGLALSIGALIPLGTPAMGVPTAAVATPSASAQRPSAGRWGHIMGIAGLNELPVRGARVRVRTVTGTYLQVRGPTRRTGRAGVFHVRVRNLPRYFVVEIRGGTFGGRSMGKRRLAAIGSAKERGEVVNEASTIAVYNLETRSPRQLRRHPKKTTRQATRRAARLLGLHEPRHRFSLGLAGRTTSASYDPGRVYQHAQRRGFNKTMRRLGKRASSPKARRTYRPQNYRGATPLGWRDKGSKRLSGPAPACLGVTECLLVVLKNTAVSLVGSAAKAGICKASGGVPLVASLTGCSTNQQLSDILDLLNAMNEQLTNMEAQLDEVLAMLADQEQTQAYNASGLGDLEGVYESWLMDQLELSDPAVTVQPLTALSATSGADEICAAAYTPSGEIPAPYQGYAFTQTPYQACLNAAENTAQFVGPTNTGSWATSIMQALTGYGAGFPPDDLLAPTYQAALSDGGTQMIDASTQNTLNQLLSSFIGLQASAFQSTLAWQTFAYAWTGQQVTCPDTPMPTQFTDPANQPLSMTGPCATTVTALFETSLEAYIAQNLGPRPELPDGAILDTYNAVGAADVPVWWSLPVDVSGKTYPDNPTYPYLAVNSGISHFVAPEYSPVGMPTTPTRIVTSSNDTFTFGSAGQLTSLVQHALSASKANSINGALADVGFNDPGTFYVMSWTRLGTGVNTYAFTPGTSCTGWPAIEPTYLCNPGVAPYIDTNTDAKPNGAGVLGTYATGYLVVGNNGSVSTTNCQYNAAIWNLPPYPNPPGSVGQLPDLAQLCIAGDNQQPNGDPGYYGLLIDTTAGDVLWSNGPYQQWQDDTIPVLTSN